MNFVEDHIVRVLFFAATRRHTVTTWCKTAQLEPLPALRQRQVRDVKVFICRALVAQWIEHWIPNLKAASSSLVKGLFFDPPPPLLLGDLLKPD